MAYLPQHREDLNSLENKELAYLWAALKFAANIKDIEKSESIINLIKSEKQKITE